MKRILVILVSISMIFGTKVSFCDGGKNDSIALSDITHELQETRNVEATPIPTLEPTPDPYEVAIHNRQIELEAIESITDKKEWFLAYKDISFKYAEWVTPSKTVFDCFTEDEVRLICKTVETECYQQDFISKVNVASVIFNRIESGDFGDSVTKIITKKNQFAYGRDIITEDTILAVMYAFEVEDTTDGCVAFRSGYKPEKWYTTETKYWTLQFVDDTGHGLYK